MSKRVIALAVLAAGTPGVAAAQQVLDRVDPTRVEEKTPQPADPVADAAVERPAAQRSATTTAAPVTVGAIALEGLEALRPSDFADIFAAYVGRTLTPAELAELADAIAGRARSRGFVFATAAIPPQALTVGVLRIAVDEGGIDEVRLRTNDNPAVRAALAPLVGAGPVTLAQVERRLLIAGDIDGLWLRRTRVVREGARNVLLVDVGADRVTATLGLANDGSRPIGPIQADATVRVNQLFAADDQLTLSGVLTPFEPDEFTYGRLGYAKRINAGGTEVSIGGSYSRTHPGAYLRSRDIEGRSWSANIGVLQPVLRRRAESLWLEGSFSLRTVKQDRRDLLARRDRLAIARLGVSGFSTLLGGRLRVNATVAQGLDILDATRASDRLSSRRDADGTFTAVDLWSDWIGPIAGRLSARLAVASQFAGQPLLVSQEVGLGGGSFLRGYDYSERSGDQGAMGSAELRYAVADRVGPATKPELYAFVDGGRVTNIDGGFGGGSLFSAGAGVRSTIARNFTADLGIAVPLSGERYDSGDAAPVLNFRLLRRF